MKTSDLLLTLIIILIFAALYFINILAVGIQNIKDNWSLYRCNPLIIPFAGMFDQDVGENFTFCIQNVQQSYMSELLKPINYTSKVVGEVGGEITDSVQSVRAFFNKIRNFITSIVQEIMAVFLNLLIGVQRLTINIKDLFAKLVGVLASMLFILSGTVMTFNSAWDGPPGQIVRAICFHPHTLVKKENGKLVKIMNLKLGDILKKGQIVHGTMKLHNLDTNNNYVEKLYSLPYGENNIPVLVSGSHLIYDKSINNFVFVKDFSDSVESSINANDLVCLITSDHTIPLGNYIFHDWEDNH